MLNRFAYTDALPAVNREEDHVRGPAASANELCEHIDVGTVKSTLALAERHRCDGLKEECLDFLADPANLRAAICTHGLRRLSSRRFLLDF